MEYSTWSRRIADLAGAVSCLEAEASPLGVPSPGSTAWHANLFQKLLPQVTEAPYLIVAVAGGTNIGKSTMFNHLVGFPASRVHPDATQTRHPVCLLPRAFSQRHELARVFPGFELGSWTSEDDAVAEGPSNRLIHREDPTGLQPPNLVLLDTPDVDGAIPVNWDRARLISHTADVLIAVLTQQKFNDAAVRRFFREAAEADKTILVVFNMVEWPEDREHCLRWLDTFSKGTGATPAHVYAVSRDRAAARENRLTFHSLSQGARPSPGAILPNCASPRSRFARSWAPCGRCSSRVRGCPSYLQELKSRAVGEQGGPRCHMPCRSRSGWTRRNFPATSLPTRSGGGWSRGVPGLTGSCTSSTAGSEPRWYACCPVIAILWIRGPLCRGGARALNRALEEIYTSSSWSSPAATSVVRTRARTVLTGDERQRAFNELRERLAATPLLTAAYRQAIASELAKFQTDQPGDDAGHRVGPGRDRRDPARHHTGMFGAADLAAHTALHVGTHSMAQIFVDLAAGTAVTVGGEGTMAGLGSPAKRLLADLFTKFYEEGRELLARMIHDCVLGRHLDRINRLARIPEGEDYKKVDLIRGELTLQLSAMQGSDTASRAAVPAVT